MIGRGIRPAVISLKNGYRSQLGAVRPVQHALFTVSSATRLQSSTSGKLIFVLFNLKWFETKDRNGVWVQLFH